MPTADGIIAREVMNAPKFPDNAAATPPRFWSRREVAVMPVMPDFKVSADEGSYFTGTNATFGTGVVGPSAAAFAATSAILGLLNKSGIGGPRSFIDYIRLILTAAPTSGTRFDLAVTLDTIARQSAGTPISAVDVNTDASEIAPNTQVIYAPTVAAAGPNVRQSARAALKVAAPVVGDEYLLVFGSVEKSASLIASATVAGRYVTPMPPLVLGGGGFQQAFIHLWSASSTAAPSFEFEVGLIER